MIERQPFTKYNLDKKQDTFTVRMNDKERKVLEEIKKTFDIKSDSKALKQLAFVGFKSVTSAFGNDFLKYLLNKNRVKLTDFENTAEN